MFHKTENQLKLINSHIENKTNGAINDEDMSCFSR